MPPADDLPLSEVESLFAGWLARRECGTPIEIEELCGEHPAEAQSLREIWARWQRLEVLRKQAGLDSAAADPSRALDRGPNVPREFSSELLARIAGRGPAFTRYHMHGEMARGGMGAILRVWDEDLQRHLAMKVILGRGESQRGDTPEVEPQRLARFLEEARVTGQLDHPGIVPVHELGLDGTGRVYFTMKLVQGKTLAEVFGELQRSEAGWTQTRVLGLVQRVCEAMGYAHSKGVVHRDLKPSNIMVGAFGEVFVMDWGLAKVLGRADEQDIRPRLELRADAGEVRGGASGAERVTPLLTAEGDVLGTPAYMSPEQARGDVQSMGRCSDIYAVGAMLYHVLAGHAPYVREGERAQNHVVLRRVLAGPPDPLSGVASGASPELAAICDKAMARDPDARYRDMAELAADLSAYVELRIVKAYGGGTWSRALKWVKRNKALAAALAAVLLSVVGGAAAFAYKAQEATDEAERAKNEAQRADQKSKEAEHNALLAREQQSRAEAETAKVLRLSDVKVLQELEAEADELWPAHPDQVPALESWIGRARELAANVVVHRSTMLEMRARAGAWSEEERARDRETHPRAAELAAQQSELSELISQLDQGLQDEARDRAEARVAELEPEIAALDQEVRSRRTWRFGSPEEQWQHDVLAELLAGLERLADGLLADEGTDATHGWSVPKRLSFAQRLEQGFRDGGEYEVAWRAALPAIREAYSGLDLAPQMGLVPIGPDPGSRLWEFAHLMTGTPATRGPDGKLVLTEDTGVVLVLLPGGQFWMGAQAVDAAQRNYDPDAWNDEQPVHAVELSMFFLSKYELTQGQWERLTANFPSAYGPTRYTPAWNRGRSGFSTLHPVELVTWIDCMTWLPRAGLTLPSEAQWEYGCRAGTSTIYWTGNPIESLEGATNLQDTFGKNNGADFWVAWESWLDDGNTVPARVGSFSANPFGLHDVHGNVTEWCLDAYDGTYYRYSAPRDPVATDMGSSARIARGGSCLLMAKNSRVSARQECSPSLAARDGGLRPARLVSR